MLIAIVFLLLVFNNQYHKVKNLSGVVIELQQEVLKRDVSISDLLRKAYYISRKLEIEDRSTWIRNELHGYSGNTGDFPQYRKVRGHLFIKSQDFGFQQMHVEDEGLFNSLSLKPIYDSVATLEATANLGNDIYKPFPNEMKNKLMEYHGIELTPLWGCPNSSFISILDSVKNRILEWTFELEKNSVLGENMSFSNDEKESAKSITYETNNYINAPLNNSQLQQNSSGSTQSLNVTLKDSSLEQVCKFVKYFDENREELDIEEDKIKEIESDVSTLKSQLDSPKPKTSIINETIKSLRSVLEGVTGSVVASNLMALIPAITVTSQHIQ